MGSGRPLTKQLLESLPMTRWLPDYSRTHLAGDARAGLTVGVMLIPQAMAYAVIAGVPPIYGLYTALVPLLVYPLLGTSRHLAVGPLAVDMLIVAAGVGIVAGGDPDRYVALAVFLALMVGVLQVLMGVARLGFLVGLVARPVIIGFVWAAAIIIAFSQAGHLTGIELPRSKYVLVMLRDLVTSLDGIHIPTLVVGAAAIVVLLVMDRFRHILPGALVAVVGGGVAVYLLGLDARGVAVVGEVPSGLPVPALPSVGHEDMRDLLPTALTLALVQFMTVASLGKIYGTRHGYRVDPNDELKAIGMANVVGSLFRSLPASGSLSRTAVNEQTGARSPLSNWMAAAVVGITLLLLMPLAEHIPMAVLAGIIVMAVIGFVHPEEVRFLFRAKRRDGYLAVFTFAVTLLLGIREGILLGIAASATALLYRLSRPHVAELGHLPGTRFFRDLDRQPGAVRLESLLLLRLDAGVTFLNAEFLRRFVLSKVDREERRVRAVILDGITINDLDTTAVEALEGVADALEDQGVELHLTGLIGPVRDVVRRSGLYEKLGKDRFHRSPHQAVKYILLEWDQADGMDRLDQYRDEVLQDEPSRGDEDLFGVRPEDVQEPG